MELLKSLGKYYIKMSIIHFLYIFCTNILGLQFGTVVTLVGSGILASTRAGWPSIYYVSGAFGIVWVMVWLLLGSESPDTHPLITQNEKYYIKSSLSDIVSDKKVYKRRNYLLFKY